MIMISHWCDKSDSLFYPGWEDSNQSIGSRSSHPRTRSLSHYSLFLWPTDTTSCVHLKTGVYRHIFRALEVMNYPTHSHIKIKFLLTRSLHTKTNIVYLKRTNCSYYKYISPRVVTAPGLSDQAITHIISVPIPRLKIPIYNKYKEYSLPEK